MKRRAVQINLGHHDAWLTGALTVNCEQLGMVRCCMYVQQTCTWQQLCDKNTTELTQGHQGSYCTPHRCVTGI